jgi:riboflavin biosynthesis pyrimidine reductase
VILLLSEQTDQDYIDYLEGRHYDYFICGDQFVDYKMAFDSLKMKYNVARILVDTGPTLSGILLKQKLVDKISLLMHPCLVGNRAPDIFEKLDLEKSNVELRLETIETLESNYLHMVWCINR